MRSMILGFQADLDQRRVAESAAKRIASLVEDDTFDIENLIEDLDHLEAANRTVPRWGGTASGDALEEASVVRAEAEWYIQHVCERVLMEDAYRLWSPSLVSLGDHELTIVTTNYDRAVELAAARIGLALDDGFGDFEDREWSSWQGFGVRNEATKLLKVHGSTDWYHANEDNRVVKLRHAMPLYGRVNIQVTPNLVVQSAAVLPSREKKINLPPYPDINHEFRRTSKNDTELAVFLGTSMRDPDILDVYQQSVDRVPTFLVAPGDREAGRGSFIRQSASIFLVSTLPMALRGDTSELLNVASHQSSTENVLEPLVDALDSARDADVRRIAIERLAAQKVALGREEVETLLRANEPDVRKYALALVPGSRDREELLRIAAKVELEIDDQDFTVELGLLDRLLNATSIGYNGLSAIALIAMRSTATSVRGPFTRSPGGAAATKNSRCKRTATSVKRRRSNATPKRPILRRWRSPRAKWMQTPANTTPPPKRAKPTASRMLIVITTRKNVIRADIDQTIPRASLERSNLSAVVISNPDLDLWAASPIPMQ